MIKSRKQKDNKMSDTLLYKHDELNTKIFLSEHLHGKVIYHNDLLALSYISSYAEYKATDDRTFYIPSDVEIMDYRSLFDFLIEKHKYSLLSNLESRLLYFFKLYPQEELTGMNIVKMIVKLQKKKRMESCEL